MRLVYHTLEAYPLDREIWTQLNYADSAPRRAVFESLHNVTWNEAHPLNEKFTFFKSHSKLEDENFEPGCFDVVFFDAFAPSRQPDMWTIDILSKVCNSIAEGGIFVTYCAKGQLKRDLQSLGLEVETLAGPPGKKEMVRALRRKSPV
jgi:tRNA U34 5-methylaminomethyl-2-thiouridine-forming methyltransferase MnmC